MVVGLVAATVLRVIFFFFFFFEIDFWTDCGGR